MYEYQLFEIPPSGYSDRYPCSAEAMYNPGMETCYQSLVASSASTWRSIELGKVSFWRESRMQTSLPQQKKRMEMSECGGINWWFPRCRLVLYITMTRPTSCGGILFYFNQSLACAKSNKRAFNCRHLGVVVIAESAIKCRQNRQPQALDLFGQT